jgi:hypothetical protein
LEGCYDSKASSAALFFGWPDDRWEDRNQLMGQDSTASIASSSSSSSSSSSKTPSSRKDSENEESDLVSNHEQDLGHKGSSLEGQLLVPMPWPMGVWAINGPTAQGQTPFSWAKIDAAVAAASDEARALTGGAVNNSDAPVRKA